MGQSDVDGRSAPGIESCGLLRVFGITCRGWLVVYGILLHGLEMSLPSFMPRTSRVSEEPILMYRKIPIPQTDTKRLNSVMKSSKENYEKVELLRV